MRVVNNQRSVTVPYDVANLAGQYGTTVLPMLVKCAICLALSDDFCGKAVNNLK